MEALVALGILIILFAAIAGGIVGLIVRLNRSQPTSALPAVVAPAWSPPKADRLPYSKKNYFFSAAERSFYEVLKRIASADHTVFAKVRLADLIYVSKGARSWQSHFNRINRKHIDFVLCDRDLAPLVAIELDDASHDEEEREERDEFVDRVLSAAALPIVHIRARRGYVLDNVRAALHPDLPASRTINPAEEQLAIARRDRGHAGRVCSPGEVPHPDERYMPPPGWRPAV